MPVDIIFSGFRNFLRVIEEIFDSAHSFFVTSMANFVHYLKILFSRQFTFGLYPFNLLKS